jgi:hypothetical protein
MDIKSLPLSLCLTALLIALVTALAPIERTLGSNVRVVYLHGAWVWTALLAFAAAAAAGLAGLLLRREALHCWSRAIGRTGLLFWISYLPISLWAMQTNWNGLFLAEPRWRLALVFATGGLLLQIGLALIEEPAWASAGNFLYAVVLVLALQNAEQVMHPPSPIMQSGSWSIRLFFSGLVILCLLAAYQLTRLWLKIERLNVQSFERSNV